MNMNAYNFTYVYDEMGNRVTKSGNGINEYYLRDQNGKELAVYIAGTNTIKMINLYGNGLIGKVDAGGNNYYYIKDHLGSIRSTIGATGAPLSAQDYYAYGGLLNQSVSGDDRYKFTGKQRDDETNYDYFGARYNNSEFGVWPSVDPLADLDQGSSGYNYCNNNPINLTDQNGLFPSLYTIEGIEVPQDVFEAAAGIDVDQIESVLVEKGFDELKQGEQQEKLAQQKKQEQDDLDFYMKAEYYLRLIKLNNMSHQADELILMIVWDESRYVEDAVPPKGSNSSAFGLMQVPRSSVTDIQQHAYFPFTYEQMQSDPQIDVKAGTALLGLKIKREHGNLLQGLFDYGPGNDSYVSKILKAYNYLQTHPLDFLGAMHIIYKTLR
jgi:RHS repeat-associated protein